MNVVKWIFALAALLFLIPLQARAAPLEHIEETIGGGESYLKAYDISIENDLSLPFQISWSADPGVSLSFWLMDVNNGNAGALLLSLGAPGTIILNALARGSYRLFIAGSNHHSDDGFLSGSYGAVPIPTSIVLLGTGLIGLIGLSRRKTNP